MKEPRGPKLETDNAELLFTPSSARSLESSSLGNGSLHEGLADLLGEKINGAHDLIDVTLRGVSPHSVKRLSEISGGVIDVSWIIAPRTLSHRLNNGQNLTADETGKLIRFGKVLIHACRVFGSKDKALRWLGRVHPALSKERSPLSLCQTEEGALLITEELDAIDHGFFA